MVEEQSEIKTENISTEAIGAENGSADKVKEEADKNGGAEETKASLLQMKIIRQVEYYFGNVNLWRDKFLKEKIKEDDGWVTIECLTTFNRLQTLSMDLEEIVNALEKSSTGLLEIHESKTKVRRSLSQPLPDQDDPILRKTAKLKTLYMKGFPASYTLDDVQDFILSQQVQNIFIKMRRDQDKNFKGSIIVELSTIEEAKKLLDNEIKLGDEVMKVMTRDDYFRYKNDKGGKGTGGGGGGVKRDNEEKGNIEDQEPPKLGCVLHFKGADEKTSREDLKEVFGKHDEEIEWVDFSIGETQGYIRFKKEGSAKTVMEAAKAANDNKIVIKDAELEVRVIEGIEEKNYWILANEDRKRPKFQGNRGRRRNTKGQEGWRKRRRPWENSGRNDKTEDKPKNTHTKFEDGGDDNTVKKDSSETIEKKPKVEATVES